MLCATVRANLSLNWPQKRELPKLENEELERILWSQNDVRSVF